MPTAPTTRADELVTFRQLFPDAPAVRTADPSLDGSVPLRAYQWCPPFTVASGNGWLVSFPFDLALRNDGERVWWALTDDVDADGVEWVDGTQFPCMHPGFYDRYLTLRPHEADGLPPMPAAFAGPDGVQLWPGLVARTRPGWSLLVRPPVNRRPRPGLQLLEGLIDTDWWFGPLEVVASVDPGATVVLHRTEPLFQVQLVHRAGVTERSRDVPVADGGLEAFTAEDWRDFRAAQEGQITGERGRYRKERSARRRVGTCPVTGHADGV